MRKIISIEVLNTVNIRPQCMTIIVGHPPFMLDLTFFFSSCTYSTGYVSKEFDIFCNVHCTCTCIYLNTRSLKLLGK